METSTELATKTQDEHEWELLNEDVDRGPRERLMGVSATVFHCVQH